MSKGSDEQPCKINTFDKGYGTEAQWPEDTKEWSSRTTTTI